MVDRSEEARPLPNGYEYEFVLTVDKRHLCAICELPYKDAVQTKCGHRFCRGCLVESLRRKRECPLDRQFLDQEKDVFVDLSTQREIMDLHVKCASERCDWVGELRDAETHLEKCTNENCQMEISRMHFQKHVNNECEWRLVCCGYCGFRNPIREAETHHQRCARFPIECVNGCTSIQIPRCEMQDHVTYSCPLTLVPCLFQFVGCKEKIERRNFGQHMSSTVENHVRLSCDKLFELEQKQLQMVENLEKQEQSKMLRDNKVAQRSIENDLIPNLEREQKQIRDIFLEDREKQHNFQEKLKHKVGDIQEQINKTEQRRDQLRQETEELIQEGVPKLQREIGELKKEYHFWKRIAIIVFVCLFATIVKNYHSKSNPCADEPCGDGGWCVAQYEGRKETFACNCKPGYYGTHCETIIGRNCFDIRQHLSGSNLDGVYWLDPNGGDHSDAFQAYCDMTSHGGGWTMCYTTDNMVNIKTEVSYSPASPFGKNGYRSNCIDVEFKEILYVDEITKQSAYFQRESGLQLNAATNFGDKAESNGLWISQGVASKSYKYQLLICDTSFYRGFFVSGYMSCWKKCDSWCSDRSSTWFRTASTNPKYVGVAFNINGHLPCDRRLISVGIR